MTDAIDRAVEVVPDQFRLSETRLSHQWSQAEQLVAMNSMILRANLEDCLFKRPVEGLSGNTLNSGVIMMRRAFHVLAIGAVTTVATAASAQQIDWKKVDEAIGKTAAVSSDVHSYGFPRTDLHVTLDGVTIKPALALGGWVAFKRPMAGRW
jgi:hypothetical protein